MTHQNDNGFTSARHKLGRRSVCGDVSNFDHNIRRLQAPAKSLRALFSDDPAEPTWMGQGTGEDNAQGGATQTARPHPGRGQPTRPGHRAGHSKRRTTLRTGRGAGAGAGSSRSTKQFRNHLFKKKWCSTDVWVLRRCLEPSGSKRLENVSHRVSLEQTKRTIFMLCFRSDVRPRGSAEEAIIRRRKETP